MNAGPRWLAGVMLLTACEAERQPQPSRPSPPRVTVPDSRRIPPGTRQVPAAIAGMGAPVQVAVPDSAAVGDSIPILITTFAGGCIWEDTTEIVVNDLRAEVRPYQRVPGGRGLVTCSAEILVNERQAMVAFGAPGLATIVVHGRSIKGDSLVTATRSVRVH